MRTRYVLFNESEGIFLGSFLGLGFWSKLDPVGQSEAVTFESAERARKVMAGWDCAPIIGAITEVRPVQIADAQYATIAECVAAGLPAWDPNAKGRDLNV